MVFTFNRGFILIETPEQTPTSSPGKIIAAKALYLLVIVAWLTVLYMPTALWVNAIVSAVNRTN